MSKCRESAIQRILDEGLDDWVPIDNVIGEARDLASSEGATVRDVAMDLIRTLIDGELMTPGIIGDNGFEPWRGSHVQLINQVIRNCDELGWRPFGAGCWLANTPEGDRAARSAVD